MTPPANAGSILNLINNDGKNAPEKAANIRLTTMAAEITKLNVKSSNQT